MVIVLGGATEALQLWIGRDAAWLDLAADVAGGLLGILVGTSQDQGRRPLRAWLWMLALGTLCLGPLAWASAAYANRQSSFPVVWDSRSALDRFFVREDGARRRPGLVLREPVPDWSAYASLRVTVENPSREAVEFGIRVSDRDHDEQPADRYEAVFRAGPGGLSTIDIPLSTIAAAPATRLMDLRHVGSVVVQRRWHGTEVLPKLLRVELLPAVDVALSAR